MKILVTGGAGFIGSNFIYYMLSQYSDYEIICVDALTYAGNLANLKNAVSNPRFRFFKADITDRAETDNIFKTIRPDVTVNFAAESHVDRSIGNPDIFVKTNIIGTQVLLDTALKYDLKRFHQVSTDEVYGDLPLDRRDLSFSEESNLKPSSPYSASKAAADLLVLSYAKTYHAPVTLSRCSNNFGPYHFPEKLIPLIITRALNNKPVPIYGKGENIRDWLYVTDHCKAVDLILHKGKTAAVYNIGGHHEMSNIDVACTILSKLNKPLSLIQYVTDRPGHDLRYAVNSGKIEKELGFMPKTSFEEGISQTIDWYLNNREWWENILSGEYRNYFKIMYDDRKKAI